MALRRPCGLNPHEGWNLRTLSVEVQSSVPCHVAPLAVLEPFRQFSELNGLALCRPMAANLNTAEAHGPFLLKFEAP